MGTSPGRVNPKILDRVITSSEWPRNKVLIKLLTLPEVSPLFPLSHGTATLVADTTKQTSIHTDSDDVLHSVQPC